MWRFHPPQLLMERGDADDALILDCKQWKDPAQIDALTPMFQNRRIGNSMFDVDEFLRLHRAKEGVIHLVIAFFQGAYEAIQSTAGFDFLRIAIQRFFKGHGIPFSWGWCASTNFVSLS